MTDVTTRDEHSDSPVIVDQFAAFWANPDVWRLKDAFTADVILRAPGESEPRRGPDAYVAKTTDFLSSCRTFG